MGRFLACEHAILLSRVEQAKSNPSCAIRCPVLLWCLRILWIPFRNFLARLDVVAASKFLCIVGFGTESLYPVAIDLRCKMRLETRTTSMQKNSALGLRDNHVYACGLSGVLACLQCACHKLRNQHTLNKSRRGNSDVQIHSSER